MSGFVIGDRILSRAGNVHPSWIQIYAEIGSHVVAGGSAVGHMHRRQGRGRDDACVVRSAGPWLAVVVADGLGSHTYARYGATFIAEWLSSLLLRSLAPTLQAGVALAEHEADLLQTSVQPLPSSAAGGITGTSVHLPRAGTLCWWSPADEAQTDRRAAPDDESPSPEYLEGIARDAYRQAHVDLGAHAANIELDIRAMGCTALTLLLNCETGSAIAAQVGDGVILGRHASGRTEVLASAPRPDDADATYSMHLPDLGHHLAVQALRSDADPLIAYYVMTDGVADDLPPDDAARCVWTEEIRRNLLDAPDTAAASGELLRWLAEYEAVGSWDDRTLVVVGRRDGYVGR